MTGVVNMTEEQKKNLKEIGRIIHEMFPNEYGKVVFSFNIKPDRKDVNVNIGTEFSTIIK